MYVYIKIMDIANHNYVDHNKLENSSRDGIPDHITSLLGNLYAVQEATAKTGHGTMDRPVPNWERSMYVKAIVSTLFI